MREFSPLFRVNTAGDKKLRICFVLFVLLFESSENPPWTCVPSKDSDQTAHSRSLIRIFPGHNLIAKHAFLYDDNEDAEQTARMRRLIF